MQISIMGCGWLGLPLGARLVSKGYPVKGSTTSKEKLITLQNYGITPFQIHTRELLTSAGSSPFWKCDLLVLNIPPGRSKDDVRSRHPREIQAIRKAIESGPVKQVIFASSTSVYGSEGGLKREEDAGTEPASSQSGEALLEAEHILLSGKTFSTTVLRLGGLYGYDRHPAKYLAGRTGLSGGDRPVNLIHRDDALEILTSLIQKPRPGEVFNAVSDQHPTRREFYTAMAHTLGLDAPHFQADTKYREWKIISNEKLKRELPYTFRYPDPADPSP